MSSPPNTSITPAVPIRLNSGIGVPGRIMGTAKSFCVPCVMNETAATMRNRLRRNGDQDDGTIENISATSSE